LVRPVSPATRSRLSASGGAAEEGRNTLPGRRIDLVVGRANPRRRRRWRPRHVPDPRGVTANAGNIGTLLGETAEGLCFEVFNWRGERTTIPGPVLGADFADAQLAAFLGDAPEWARTSSSSSRED
jgi:hypothetical protein